jgi:hypothetical protein
MKSKANQPNNFGVTQTAKNLILALLVGMIVTFFMLILLENFLNKDTVQTHNLITIEHSIYPKNGNREERAKWWCKSWKLNNNKCQTWIKTLSEVEDPYFDLDVLVEMIDRIKQIHILKEQRMTLHEIKAYIHGIR